MNQREAILNGSPRLAATVMMVRPSDSSLEVFMLRRSEASHFAPDVFVFPGGTVDPGDRSPALHARARGIDERLGDEFRARSHAALPAEQPARAAEDARAIVLAAIRELFEESGMLVAVDAEGRPARSSRSQQSLRDARAALAAGSLTFAQMLQELDLYAAGEALALFSHWITPPDYPKRYDTHFFTASATAEDVASADACETHDGVWIAPRLALEGAREGSFKMVYPTIKHVERLTAFDSPEALMAFARMKPIYTIMPRTIGSQRFEIPAELEQAW